MSLRIVGHATPNGQGLPPPPVAALPYWIVARAIAYLLWIAYNNPMSRKPHNPQSVELYPWFSGAHIPMRVIRGYAREVAEHFQPDKIILFGSYAYGTPHDDSDVDILVIMPARNEIDQACRIDRVIDPQFPLDLQVSTPKNLAWRLKEGDSFLTEITTKGKVLYEKADSPVGPEGGIGLPGRKGTRSRKRASLR